MAKAFFLSLVLTAAMLEQTSSFSMQSVFSSQRFSSYTCSKTATGFTTSGQRRPSTGGTTALRASLEDFRSIAFALLADSEASSVDDSASSSRFPTPLAPIITMFDERRGCARDSNEYRGKKSNTPDDNMCVKIVMDKRTTQQILAELIPQLSPANRRAKGIIK